jgi:Cu/Zn superoxide dismutase
MRTPLLLALLAFSVAACERPERAGPADPIPEHPDTVQTPLGLEADNGAPVDQAEVRFEPIGNSGVSGHALLEQVDRGVRVTSEVGGLGEGAHSLRVVRQTDCREQSFLDPGEDAAEGGDRVAVRLGALDVIDDGSARYERTEPRLVITGPNSVVGMAMVVVTEREGLATAPDGETVACGIIGPAVR